MSIGASSLSLWLAPQAQPRLDVEQPRLDVEQPRLDVEQPRRSRHIRVCTTVLSVIRIQRVTRVFINTNVYVHGL